MIELVEQLDAALEREIGGYLAAAAGDPARAAMVSVDHDPRWLSILREALGHRPMALLARRRQPSDNGRAAGAICGYLPLALVTSRLFGRFLVSLPYLNRAGVVADEPAIAAALIERAVALADQHAVQYVELRHGQPVEHAQLGGRRAEKVRMLLDLPADPDTLWKQIDTKVRNQVRKGEKSGLSIQWGGLEQLDGFYDVFAVNMRDLGTPVYPRKLFAQILTRLSDSAELAVVRHEGRPIAGALLVHAGAGNAVSARAVSAGYAGSAVTEERCDAVSAVAQETRASVRAPITALSAFPAISSVPSASSLRAFSHTNANMWMYHHLLLRAIERGSRAFDFGRSSLDSGTFKFKKQWGAQAQPTVWQYHVRFGDVNAVRPDSPKYRRRVEAWQKLPVWLTRLLGPAIVRGIP